MQRETFMQERAIGVLVPVGARSSEPVRRWWRTRAAVRFAALTVLVSGLAAVMVAVHPDRQAIASALATKNAFAPAIAIVGSALLTAALVPRTLLSAVGGLLFGWVSGAGYILLGVTLGAIVAYTVGRYLGREFMAKHLRGRILQVEQAVADRGMLAVAASRMIPIIPFCLANYIFGTTSVRFLPFVAGTVLGALPATLAYAALGSATAHHNTTGMTVAGAVVVTLGVGGSIGTFFMWRRRPRAPNA